MATSEARKRANAKYAKKAYKRINLCLHKINNKNIIDYLDSVDSKNGFIIKCINAELERMKKKQ